MLECDIGTSHIDQYLGLSAALAIPGRGPYPERTTLNTRIFFYGDVPALGIAKRLYGLATWSSIWSTRTTRTRRPLRRSARWCSRTERSWS